jgi:HK97 family phage major capsid protein
MRIMQLRQKAADLISQMEAISAAAGANRMTDEQRAQFATLETEHQAVCGDIAIEEKLAAARAAQPAIVVPTGVAAAAPRIEMGVDHATEQPWSSLGEQLMAVRSAATPGTRRIDPRLYAGPTGANTDVPSDGGFLVQKDQAAGLIERAYTMGQVSSRVFRLHQAQWH